MVARASRPGSLTCFCIATLLFFGSNFEGIVEKIEVERLRSWFLAQRRDLPWRETTTPYAVWVSEVMLQQTQVAVVIPYFLRWMTRFPTIEALAQAPLNDVIKEWEGLGYYSRARNLHEGARYVMANYAGELPSTEKQLGEIKGLGAYTVGAILSFAFHQKAAAVDGNVLRVLARYYCLDEDICKSGTLKQIQHLAHGLLPENEPWHISEALIELGATICMRTPKCHHCPLNQGCLGFIQGKAHALPVKSIKQQTQALFRAVAVISCEGHFLLRKEENGKVMSGLFQFPFFELENSEIKMESHRKSIKNELKINVEWQGDLPQVKHSFTRYRALLMPQIFTAKTRVGVEGYNWYSLVEMAQLPFSSGHRRVFEYLQKF